METIGSPLLWGGFLAFVALMLALDLGVFHKKAHAVGFKEAAIWSAVWVSLSLLFNAGLAWKFGSTRGMEFLTGYLLEKSLSIDNVFVFIVIFSTLKIPGPSQHRVLFWGILAALVLRAVMIFAGAALLTRFHWLIYVFGAFLIFTGVQLYRQWRSGADEGSKLIKLAYKYVPSTPHLHGEHFFTIENGRRLATPLFMALVLVELSDVVFALDSIPAIFAVTTDPFIVFTSNIFAILGLRSLYFLLSGMVDKFHYLKPSLAGVLLFVGTKMALADVVKLPSWVSLLVIAGLLGAGVAASLRWAPRPAPHHPA
ncbi:MAG: ygjT2 [Myxococcaceae bacterium]|nr:ygjT2 [Myxococcaceae bacterium]